MKNLLIVFFLLLSITAFSQFRMVGTATWSTLNDSTYQGTVSFQSDLTGMGYLATHIVDTFRLFTPVEKIYRIDSVWNKTFSSATLRIVEMLGTQGVPVGQVMVFNPDGRNTIPQNPFGSTGATAQLNAAVDTWNARQIGTSSTTNNVKCLERQHTQAGHTFSIGDAVFWDADTLKLASVNSLLPAQAVVTGFVPDSDIVIIAYTGECETTSAHGFTQDSAYYTGRTAGVLIQSQAPDTSQFLFKPKDATTLIIAISDMFIGNTTSSQPDLYSYQYCINGTSCITDSLFTQVRSTVDTVFLNNSASLENGEWRCIDNQTTGNIIIKGTGGQYSIDGDSQRIIAAGETACFYFSPNGIDTYNWYTYAGKGEAAGASAGIDSTFVQNDSVFISSGGDEYFSGISDASTNVANTWYVNKNGNNSTSESGNFFKQGQDPFYVARFKAPIGSTIRVEKGTYTAGINPAFSTPFRLHGLASKDSTTIIATPNTVFTAPLNHTNTYPIVSDAGSSTFSSDSVRIFSLRGYPDIILNSSNTSPKIPIGFYNENSVADVQIGRLIYLGGGRNWAMQAGCKTFNADINYVEISGGVVVSTHSSSPFVFNRVHNIKIKNVIADGRSDYLGSFRYQTGKDSMSVYNISVGNFYIRGATQFVGVCYYNNNEFNTGIIGDKLKFNYIFNNITSFVNSNNTNTYRTNSYSYVGEHIIINLHKSNFKNSTLNHVINQLETKHGLFGRGNSEIASNLDNTTLYIKVGKGVFSGSSAIYDVFNLNLINNSKIIIDCEDCTFTNNQSAMWLQGITTDATSSVVIRGKWTVSGARAVINTRMPIVLEDCTLINDGTVAAVQSDTPVNIIVKSAYTNSLVTDADVTELVNPIVKNSSVK